MTTDLQHLFAGGWIFDFALIVMVVEGVALAAYRIRTGRGVALAGLTRLLLAGGLLLVAFRADTGGAALWAPACLAMAFVAHLLELRARWEHGGRGEQATSPDGRSRKAPQTA